MKIQATYSKPSQNSMTPSSLGAHSMTAISTGMPFATPRLTNSVKMIYFFHCEFHGSSYSKGRPQKVPVLGFLTAGLQCYSSHSLLLEPTVSESQKNCFGLPFTEMQELRRGKNSASF